MKLFVERVVATMLIAAFVATVVVYRLYWE
jgi:hypothetical protein